MNCWEEQETNRRDALKALVGLAGVGATAKAVELDKPQLFVLNVPIPSPPMDMDYAHARKTMMEYRS